MKDKPNDPLNPPDMAIALIYRGESAPEVIAKGQGEMAAEMIRIAEEHDIPLQGDAALAEFLCDIPLGEEIPESLYLAVAKVLAFAYMLSGKFENRPS